MIIRLLNGAGGTEAACFDGLDFRYLLPDEDVTTGEDAELLKKRLIDSRHRLQHFQCLTLAAEAGRLRC
jgi:hypothetical protein